MGQKYNVAVFSSNWLGVSETFIFRQLMALECHDLRNIVLTQQLKESYLKSEYGGRVYYKKIDKISFYFGILDRKIGISKNGYVASFLQKRCWGKALKNNCINLVHAHYGPAGLRILGLVQAHKIPLITTFHGNDASAMLRKKAYRKALVQLFKYSYIITVSEFLRKRLIELGADEKRTICHYVGTDLNRFQFTEHVSVKERVENCDRLTFLQVSNFVEKKGHKYTIEAFKLYLNEYPNSELLLAGDGPLKLEMVNLVASLDLTDKVKFLGAVSPDSVAKLMNAADVFLHHSITGNAGSEEGIPTVLMEAMASGIPVVSTLHAGIPELVTDGCGILVKEKNITEYAERLGALLTMDTYSMTKKAMLRVHKYFDVNKQNDILIELYRNVIDDKPFDLVL